jgi:FkbM family methyltransferase
VAELTSPASFLIAAGRPIVKALRGATAWFHRAAGLAVVHGHTVAVGALPDGATVLDLGAHRGAFSHEMAERWGCRCFAVEPVAELLEQAPRHPRIHPHRGAVAARTGPVTFHLADNPEAGSLDPRLAALGGARDARTVEARSLADWCRHCGLDRVDVVKLDVEGAELPVLEGAPEDLLARIGQITVEFHDFLPGFSDHRRLAQVKRRLAQSGFRGFVASRPRGDHGDVLFLGHPCRVRRSFRERLALGLLGRVMLPLERLLLAGRRRL